MTNVTVTAGAHATPPAVTSESRNHMIKGRLHNRQSASYVHKVLSTASLNETDSGHVLFNKLSGKQPLILHLTRVTSAAGTIAALRRSLNLNLMHDVLGVNQNLTIQEKNAKLREDYPGNL
jgi:hypothetical protein